MAEINLKYNPYTREVERCQVNGEDESFPAVWGDQTRELGEWASAFVEKLDAKYNDDRYVVAFTGIERDLNFLEDAAAEYMRKVPGVTVTVKAESVCAVDKGFDELRNLFCKMQKESPFEELKSKTVKELFDEALSSEFEMAVIATMSSGKSTLINAMLHRDLLPARNEATTSNIVRIHDVDGQDGFKAVALNGDGVELETIEDVTPADLDRLNSLGNDESKNNYVSVCDLYGDIPGICSKNVRLVLTDTPGPNYSQNVAHRAHTYSLFQKEYKPLILYVLNASQLGTNDDSLLLDRVAEAMAESGRQSQDRFIFVLNKADEFDPDREPLEKKIADVRAYLEKRKIMNPRIFPCDARSAKVFRQYLQGALLTEKEEVEILPHHENFVKREWRHFSRLAPLSKANVALQQRMLLDADRETDERRKSVRKALVYTGVPAIELAITEYLEKYALPAKLSRAVDSFRRKMSKLRLEAKAEAELKGNECKIAEAKSALKQVADLVSSGETGKRLVADLQSVDVRAAIREKFELANVEAYKAYQNVVGAHRNESSLDPALAKQRADKVHSALKELQARFKADLDGAIWQGLRASLTEGLDKMNSVIRGLLGDNTKLDFGPVGDLLGDCEVEFSDAIHEYEFNEQVKTGTRWVENTNKRWWKPWTWFDADGWNEDVYTECKKINFKEFVENRIDPEFERFISDSRASVEQYAAKESAAIRRYLEKKFRDIQKKMEEKVKEKQGILKDKDRFEQKIAQNKKNIKWLQDLKDQIDSVLAI